MTSPSAFITFAVTLLLACYMFDSRSRLFVLTVAITCALGSAYGFVQGAWPPAFVEALCLLIAVRRLWRARREY
jgi:CHASE2 domain-containing sensor protein